MDLGVRSFSSSAVSVIRCRNPQRQAELLVIVLAQGHNLRLGGLRWHIRRSRRNPGNDTIRAGRNMVEKEMALLVRHRRFWWCTIAWRRGLVGETHLRGCNGLVTVGNAAFQLRDAFAQYNFQGPGELPFSTCMPFSRTSSAPGCAAFTYHSASGRVTMNS